MNKFFLLATTLMMTTTSLFAQITKSMNVGDFSAIEVSGAIELTIISEGSDNFSFELPANVDEEQFNWENKNGVLTLKLKDQLVLGKGKKVKPSAKATVVCSSLSRVKASSKSSIVAKEVISSNDLTLDLTSSSDVALNLDVKNLDVNATTSAKVTLSGSVEYLTVKASAAAYVNTITMNCQNALINTSTNAECYATAIKKFEAKATTNSNVFYKGKPEIEKVSSSTLGAVEHF